MHDLIIIWTGSAGLPAGMYASRYKLSNLVIGELPGGALATSHCVENWPWVLSAPGWEIMSSFLEQAKHAGSEIIQDRVETVSKIGENHFEIKTQKWDTHETKRIILATGNTYKKLGIPGEMQYYGQGVSYCATCDGNFYKWLTVAVIGAGNTAITEALYLSDICKHVHILVRSDRSRAEDIWIDKAKSRDNITFHYNTQAVSVEGGIMGVTGLKLKTSAIMRNVEDLSWWKAIQSSDVFEEAGNILPLDGVFVAIGSSPITSIVDNLAPEKDAEGCLIVDKRQETSVNGLYAAGDVTTNSNKFRQTIMSAAEGCLAANSVHEDILRIGH